MTATTSLELIADSDPTVLVRIGGLLSTFSIVPACFKAVHRPDGTILISIRLGDTSEGTADLLIRKMAQIPQCVDVVRQANQ